MIEKVKNIHPTKLNYIHDSEKFTLEIYFIQTLIYLCEIDVLKIKIQIEKSAIMTKKKYFVNIASNFFNYTPEKFELDFLKNLSVKNQYIDLNRFLDLTLNENISNSNWNSDFEKQMSFDKDKLINNIHLNKLKTTKYFNYFEQLYQESKTNNIDNKRLSIIINNLDFDYELFDYIYEKTKTYILDKRKILRKFHWGKINATPGI